MTEPRYLKGTVALLIGCALNHFGDRLLDVKMELFYGLSTFSFAWMVDVFLLPCIVGIVVSLIFGLGGKWLCYFPPLIVRSISYIEIAYISGVPQGSHLNPLGWWGFFVILAMEASAIGGVIGEFMIKDTYGSTRPPPEEVAQVPTQPDQEP